jgi:hypothetical protein
MTATYSSLGAISVSDMQQSRFLVPLRNLLLENCFLPQAIAIRKGKGADCVGSLIFAPRRINRLDSRGLNHKKEPGSRRAALASNGVNAYMPNRLLNRALTRPRITSALSSSSS